MRTLLLLVLALVFLGARSSHADDADVARLISDLSSDTVRRNAVKARRALIDLTPPPIAELEAALHSPDLQQRQLAADVLRRFGDYEPSDDLVRVTFEGLANDHFTEYPGPDIFLFNAVSGSYFLHRHFQKARPYLEQGLYSEDEQQKFLCAYILAMNRDTENIERITDILIPHLEDNNLFNDAQMSKTALCRLGPDALPWLHDIKHTGDAQQRKAVAEIERRIEESPSVSLERFEVIIYPNAYVDPRRINWDRGE